MRRIKIETKRLIIRPYRLSDYTKWRDAYTNLQPAKNRFDKGPYPLNECDQKVFSSIVKRHQDLAKKDSTYIWGIFRKSDNALIGATDIFVIQRDCFMVANLGYHIFNNYWRQGYARESMKAVTKKALESLKLNRLEAAINLDNKPSLGFAKTMKWQNEGIRKDYICEDGKWVDNHIFSITRRLVKLPHLKPDKDF